MWLQVAAASYEVRIDGWSGTPALVRVALPAAGGIGEQDARTMQALDVVSETARRRRAEQVREARRKKTRRTEH